MVKSTTAVLRTDDGLLLSLTNTDRSPPVGQTLWGAPGHRAMGTKGKPANAPALPELRVPPVGDSSGCW